MKEKPTVQGDDQQLNEKLLRTQDHDRGMHDGTATIIGLIRPSRDVLRFTAKVNQGGDDPAWTSPNVTIRIELGPEFEEASRIYTVRRYWLAEQTVEIDVVLHDNSSPMMRWCAGLKPGTLFAFRGPRQHFVIPQHGQRPVAIFADATAIPALWAMLSHAQEPLVGTA